MARLFIEQPLASPGSAKHTCLKGWTKCYTLQRNISYWSCTLNLSPSPSCLGFCQVPGSYCWDNKFIAMYYTVNTTPYTVYTVPYTVYTVTYRVYTDVPFKMLTILGTVYIVPLYVYTVHWKCIMFSGGTKATILRETGWRKKTIKTVSNDTDTQTHRYTDTQTDIAT